MKTIISFLLVSLTLALTIPAQAKMVSIAQDSGDFTLTSELDCLEIFIFADDFIGGMGIYSPVPDHLYGNAGNDNIAALLTRTYSPWGLNPGWGNVSLGWDYFYEFNQLGFMLMWSGTNGEGQMTGFSVPLVDLSHNVINGMYFHNSIARDGDTYYYDFDIFADATEVPEPSTAGFFVTGIALLSFARYRKRNNNLQLDAKDKRSF